MVTQDLNTLSFIHAVNLLKQEGYIEGRCQERADDAFDRVFIYPYTLYNEAGNIIDTVYFVEYCAEIEDDEYIDGRKTWNVLATEWTRYNTVTGYLR